MDKIAVIVTERLKLRGICENDTEKIVQWRSNPEVYRYFKYPRKLTEEEHIKWYKNRYLSDKTRIDFMAFEKKSGFPVGVFGLVGDDENFKTAEVSYILDERFRGLGYAHEAVCSVMDRAVSEFGTECFTAVIHKKNKASLTFAKREGFKQLSESGDFLLFEKKL